LQKFPIPQKGAYAAVLQPWSFVSPSHQDKDTFLSCVMVSFSPPDGFEIFMCNGEMATAVYFVFLNINYQSLYLEAIVLFFNR
jgi:hypothetical protein